jgi:ADP-ribosylglycohydrolase
VWSLSAGHARNIAGRDGGDPAEPGQRPHPAPALFLLGPAVASDLVPGLPSMRERPSAGANMRVAPAGLVPHYDLPTLAAVAQVQAALTHGHPTALTASELTAYAIRVLRDGAAVADLPALLRERCHTQHSVYHHDWLGPLWQRAGAASPGEYISHGWRECLDILDRLDHARLAYDGTQDPCRYTGEGWIAEEALATALLCAIHHADHPVDALARAATTSGDSDSIACLAGAFLGAAHGMTRWPPAWANQIEYRDELAELGDAWDKT